MAKGRNQHVVPRDGGWAVKPEGGQRASSIHGTQREAIDRSREVPATSIRSSSSTDGTAESASGQPRSRPQSADGLKPCVPTVQARQT
jgi:hypothetical protein